jgi:HEAT repeat protein
VGWAAAQDEKPPKHTSQTASEWIEILKAPPDRQSVAAARQALGAGGPYAKTAISFLIDALAGEQPGLRDSIAETLADYGPVAVPSLVRALKRREVGIRLGAARTLGAMKPRPTEAVPALIAAMSDSDAQVRSEAVRALGAIRRPYDKTVPALVAALRDKDTYIRGTAIESLGMLGSHAAPAVPEISKDLKDKELSVRSEAATALRFIGPAAKVAVPALIDSLANEKEANQRVRIVAALSAIGPAAKDAVPALVALLHDQDESLREWAADALGEIGPDARSAVPELLKLAKDRNNNIRDHALGALGGIGRDAKAAVPLLLEALKDQPKGMGPCRVAVALGNMGPEARTAVPELMALARNLDADLQVREAAANAVIKLDPKLAAKEQMEVAHLNVRLGKVPPVKLEARPAPSAEQKKRIKALIAQLAEIKEPDFGMSATLTGQAFAPVAGHATMQAGLITDHRLKTSDAFRRLVAMGPEALPFLLEALEDKTPTRLKVGLEIATVFTGGTQLEGNPLNASERRLLSQETTTDDEEDDFSMQRDYVLKVGDVCFVAIGQIVGRPYNAARYQPTAMIVVNNPAETKVLRERVRALWSSDDPAKKLLNSLLIDYATEGLFNGKNLNNWSEGNDRQVEAVVRLLYYYPKETAPLIAARLRGFDVKESEDWMRRDVKNGVRIRDFIKAVSWCKAPGIQEALAGIGKRTDDPLIKEALDSGK